MLRWRYAQGTHKADPQKFVGLKLLKQITYLCPTYSSATSLGGKIKEEDFSVPLLCSVVSNMQNSGQNISEDEYW